MTMVELKVGLTKLLKPVHLFVQLVKKPSQQDI